ncbi:hypothetical protein [Methylobacterium sp. JK268]
MTHLTTGARILAVCVAALLLSGGAAGAQGTERERNACMGDAMTLCASAIPDEHRIETCLRRNSAQISAPCRVVLGPSEDAPGDTTGSLPAPRAGRHASTVR